MFNNNYPLNGSIVETDDEKKKKKKPVQDDILDLDAPVEPVQDNILDLDAPFKPETVKKQVKQVKQEVRTVQKPTQQQPQVEVDPTVGMNDTEKSTFYFEQGKKIAEYRKKAYSGDKTLKEKVAKADSEVKSITFDEQFGRIDADTTQTPEQRNAQKQEILKNWNVKKNADGTSFIQVGVVGRGTNEEVDTAKIKIGSLALDADGKIAGNYVVNLTGDETTNEQFQRNVINQVLGNLTQDEDIKRSVLDLIQENYGDQQFALYTPLGKIPIYSKAHAKEVGRAIDFNGETFTQYEDKDAELVMMVKAAQIAKAKHGEVTKETLKGTYQTISDYYKIRNSTEDAYLKELDRQKAGGEVTFSQWTENIVQGFLNPLYNRSRTSLSDGKSEMAGLAKELGIPLTTEDQIREAPSGELGKNQEYFDSLKQSLEELNAVNLQRQTNKIQPKVMEVMRNSGSSIVSDVIANSATVLGNLNKMGFNSTQVKAMLDSKNIIPKDAIIAGNVLQFAIPMLISAVDKKAGMVAMIWTAEKMTRDLPVEEDEILGNRNIILGTTLATMGLSSLFGGKIAQAALSPAKNLAAQAVTNVAGSAIINTTNIQSFYDEKGNFQGGEFALNLAVDVFQLASTTVNAKKVSKEVPRTLNLFMRDVDNPDSVYVGMLDRTNQVYWTKTTQEEFKLAAEQASTAGKPVIVSDLNATGIQSMIANGAGVKDRIMAALTGVAEKSIEKTVEGQLKAGGEILKVVKKEDIPQSVINSSPPKEDRTWNIMKVLEAGMDIHEARVQADVTFFQTVKSMMDKGLVQKDEKGFLTLTDKGKTELETISKVTETVQADADKLAKTLDIGNGKEIQLTPELQGNPFVGKYYRRDGRPPVRIYPSELLEMSPKEREAVTLAVAAGKLQVTDEGYIVSGDYTFDSDGQKVSFGNTQEGYEGQFYFKLGEAMQNGDDVNPLIQKFLKTSNKTKEQVLAEAPAKYKKYLEQIVEQKKEFKEFGVENGIVDLSIPFTKKQPVEPVKVEAEGSTEKPDTTLQANRNESSHSKKVSSDYTFRPLREDESLPKSPEITLQDDKGRLITLTKHGKHNIYSDVRENGAIKNRPHASLEQDIRSGLYKYGEFTPPSKMSSKERSSNRLTDEDHAANETNYRTGEVKITPDFSVDASKPEWRLGADTHFEVDPKDPSNFVGNRRLVDGAKALVFDMEMNKDLIGGFAERPRGVGRDLEKGIANERKLIETGGERKTNLLPEELDTLQKLADTLKDSKETNFSLTKFNPDSEDVPYSEFKTILPHEKTHVEVAKLNPDGSMLLPEPVFKGALSTKHGAIIREATKGENWDDNTIAHEVLANGASPDKLDLIGITSPEQREAYNNVYTDLIEGLNNHYGEGASDKVLSLADPEVLRKFEELSNERTNENRPRTDSEGHGLPEGTRKGGVSEDVSGTTRLGIKSREEWRGTGIKSVTLRRYTHSGDPLELTGYAGEETARRKLDGADPTINFFVQKPDGQFIIEGAFRDTRLIPSETSGDFNLIDLGTDVEAWNKYSNMSFPKFQEWAESKGYQGFFSGREDLADATTYRASLFGNESNRKMLSSSLLASKSREAPQNEAGFYSPTEEAVLTNEKRLPKVANGADWYNKIRGLEGVKTEELDWMGLDIFLDGKEKVSKEDVLEYIQTHKVEIKETVAGGNKEKATNPELQAKIKEAGDKVAKIQLEFDNAYVKAKAKKNEIREKHGILGTKDVPNIDSLPMPVIDKEYYASAEYKEFAALDAARTQAKKDLDRLNVQEFNANKTVWSYGNLVLGGEKTNDVEISLQVPRLEKGRTGEPYLNSYGKPVSAGTYEEPHGFPDNTYVHLRGNERLSVMDRLKKFFHIEEIQSQLHQAGKNEGYQISKADAVKSWKVVSKKSEGDRVSYIVQDKEGNIVANQSRHKDFVKTDEDIIRGAYDFKYGENYKGDSYADEVAWEQSMDKQVPDAPFKTNWIDHGFLKALRYAVENGHDKITWTTGKQQTDRNQNELRQNVKKIEYSVDNALMLGHVDLGITNKDGKTSRLTVPLEGKAARGELTGKTLDQLLGKKMAEEIRANKEGVFEGEGLSIGGGLHKFVYDEYLPRFAAKFGKKFGAEVGKEKVDVNSHEYKLMVEEGKWSIRGRIGSGNSKVLDESGNIKYFPSKESAEEYRAALEAEEVHSMTIPQAMKESVQMGVKMFSKSREQEQADYVHRLVEPAEIRRDLKMKSYYETSAPKAHAEQITTLVKEGFFSNLSAVREGMSPEESKTAMASLKKDLEDYGLQVVDAEGRYTMDSTGEASVEPSFMVYYPNKGTSRIVQAMSNKYGQEAALHGEAGKYSLEFQDGKRITTDKADFNLAKDKDGTVITLPNGKEVKYSADFGKGQEVPAPQDFASQIAQANKRIEIRKNLKDTTILTPEDIKSAWNEGIVTDAQGNKLEPNAVFDESGKKVGTSKIDSEGREFVEFDKARKGDPVYLIDGKSTSGDRLFKNTASRTLIGTTGMFQELATMSMPEIKGMDKGSPEYKREVLVKGITGILDQSIGADINAVGRTWFTEKADDFAARVGKDVKDVTNSVVKLALWLHTAVTSPNTGVKDNANYAMNALASMVRMHKTGELHIPEFQVNNDGSYKMKPDGTPTKLGMAGLGMEKTRMLTEGYVPVASVEGKEAVKNGGEVRKEAKGNYVLSPVAKAMMDKHGTLQGLFSYLLSPTVDGSKFNKATDIYGDKVGAFMSNLMGFTQIPTIDTWMNRYLMGLTGDAITVTRDKSGKVVSIKDNTQNFTVEQGDFYRAAIQKATADFNTKTGQNLSPADVQAIVWTQVRSMFDSLSKLESKEIDFSEAHAQIKEQFNNKGLDMPSAPHNPELIAEANNKTPIVKAVTEDGMGKAYGKDYFIDQDPSGAFFVRERTALEKKNKEIDLSEPDLKKGDFDAWLNVAVRMIDNANLSDGEVAQIKKLSDAKDIDGLNAFVLSLNKMSVVQLIAQALRVNPLIGLKNLARNITSNEFHQIMDEAARLPSFVINTVLTGINKKMGGDDTQSIYHPSFIAQAKGIYKALTEGIPDALKFMVHGGDTATFENGAIFREKTTGIWALKPLEAMVKYGFRLQEAADKPFKAQAYYRALDGLTRLKQKEMGNGTSFEDARNSLTVADYDQAFDISLYLSFQDKNKIAQSFYKWKDGKSPLVQALTDVTVPYVKTPLNVVKVMADYSGIYPILKLANKNFSHDNWKDFRGTLAKTLDNPEDRAAISWALGKGAVGLTATIIGHSLAKAGIMTAFYEEKDGKEKDLMGARGTSYGSITVDGRSYDITAMNPVAFYLLAGAAWANKEKTFDEGGQKLQDDVEQKKILLDTATESGDEDKIKIAQKSYDEAVKAANPDLRGSSTSAVMTTILKNFALQVPILNTGIRTLNDSDNEKNFIPNLILNTLGANRVLPAVVGEVAQKMDGKSRVIEYSSPVKRLKDTVQSMIPSTSVGAKAADATGVDMLRGREALPVKYDMLGREIAAPRAFDPFKSVSTKEGKLETELNRFKVVIPHSGAGTTVEKNEEKGKKGQYFAPALEELVNSPSYDKAPDTIKKKMIQDTIGYLNPEYKNDKLEPVEEKHNLTLIRERDLFGYELQATPEKFSRDRVITDEKLLKLAAKAKIKELSLPAILDDIRKSGGMDKFLRTQFTHNIMVGKDTSYEESQKNYAEFVEDPEGMLVKWYLKDKEYDERQPRLKARREGLVKEGKTEAEINAIMAKDRVNQAKVNKANLSPKIVMKAVGGAKLLDRSNESYTNGTFSEKGVVDPKDLEKWKGQRPSENVIDIRKGSEGYKIAKFLENEDENYSIDDVMKSTNFDKLNEAEREHLRLKTSKLIREFKTNYDETNSKDADYLSKLKALARNLY